MALMDRRGSRKTPSETSPSEGSDPAKAAGRSRRDQMDDAAGKARVRSASARRARTIEGCSA